MEGHLFHVYSHVYTLNNLYAENMTVGEVHEHQISDIIKSVCFFFLFKCLSLIFKLLNVCILCAIWL